MKRLFWAVASVIVLSACTAGPSPASSSPSPPSPTHTSSTPAPVADGVRVPDPRHVVAGFGSVWVQSARGSLWRISQDGAVEATILGVLPSKRVDTYAQPLAVGFGSVWTLTGDAVVRIDPTTNEPVEHIGLPNRSTGIVAGEHEMWVMGGPALSLLIRVDPRTNTSTVVRRQLVSSGGIGYGFGSVWWINLSEAGGVSRIEPQTGRRLGEIGAQYARFVVPTTTWVWLINAQGGVIRVDPVTDSSSRRWVRTARSAFGVSYSNGIVWINDGDLVGIDAATGEVVVRRHVLGRQPWRKGAGVAQLGADVWVVDASGDRVVPVAVGTARPVALVPHGSIVYARQASDSLDGKVTLAMISPAGGNPTPLQIPGIGATFVGEPAWSRDGSRLAIVVGPTGHVHRYAGDGNLIVIDADGTKLQRLTSGLVASSPAWSPDGKQLAFVRYQGNQLVVVNADGSGQRVVSKARRYYQAPSWSPDGRWIAFQSHAVTSPSSEDTAVFLIRPDGTGMHQVPGTDGGGEPAWSPYGRSIAYRGIRVTDANGSRTHIVTRCPRPCGHYDFAPAWSPDGSRVVFVRQADSDGTFKLSVVDLTTGKIHPLTPSETNVGRASWRP